jgi:hypothetical protein
MKQGEFADARQAVLLQVGPKDWNLSLVRWEGKPNGQPFQARFILTDGALCQMGVGSCQDSGVPEAFGPECLSLRPDLRLTRNR